MSEEKEEKGATVTIRLTQEETRKLRYLGPHTGPTALLRAAIETAYRDLLAAEEDLATKLRELARLDPDGSLGRKMREIEESLRRSGIESPNAAAAIVRYVEAARSEAIAKQELEDRQTRLGQASSQTENMSFEQEEKDGEK